MELLRTEITAKNKMHILSNSAAVCDSHLMAFQFIWRADANTRKPTAHRLKATNVQRFILTRKKESGLLLGEHLA